MVSADFTAAFALFWFNSDLPAIGWLSKTIFLSSIESHELTPSYLFSSVTLLCGHPLVSFSQAILQGVYKKANKSG